MNMGLCSRDQLETISRCKFDVPIDITLGINDNRFTRTLTPDEIRRRCEFLVVDHPHKHDSYLSLEGSCELSLLGTGTRSLHRNAPTTKSRCGLVPDR